ncbi:MAG: sigma 54-interacting transcriptional regulator, partial [Bdellovibrionales bacterium]|nr:sigma 54-interacting transcriptional regulator [Bdellovibrionales bacterium]
IFLDEIGELKPEMQVKLLRVLQERKFVPVGGNREIKTNARIISATNRNLEKMIEDGTFREDLFYRLNVMPIFLPPLRDRVADLEGLANYFLRAFALEHKKNIESISEDALEVLKKYHWPGNIRELENVIERAFIIETNSSISVRSLPDQIVNAAENKVNIPLPQYYSGPLDFDKFKEDTEKEFIVNALNANQGKINKTVAEANIPKNTLLRKIKKYGIDVKNMGKK